MKPRKQSSSAQQGLRNSRASLSRILLGIWSIKQLSGGGKLNRCRVSSGAAVGYPKTRPEDTGAGSEKHRGTFGAEIPDQLVMGLQNA